MAIADNWPVFKIEGYSRVFFAAGWLFIENLFPKHTFTRVKKMVQVDITTAYMIFIDDVEKFNGVPYNYDLISI